MDLKNLNLGDLAGPAPERVITDDQIERAAQVLRRALNSHRNELPYDSFEYLLGGMLKGSGFGEELIRTIHESVDKLIIQRRVKVDRSRTPQEALAATGMRVSAAPQDVETIPRGEGDIVVVGLFRLLEPLTVRQGDLDMNFRFRDIAPDPIALLALAGADPLFVDAYPMATQWQGPDGSYYGMTFHSNGGERSILVTKLADKNHPATVWSTKFWFGGRKKHLLFPI